MKRSFVLPKALLFAGIVLLPGCHQLWATIMQDHGVSTAAEATPETATSTTVTDYASLVTELEAAGATITPAGAVSQPFFEVPGQLIQVNSADVQVFDFPDEASAQAAAAQISPDGSSTATMMMSWMATPHFYRSGKLIALYVGDDAEVISLLTSLLGVQFAGR